MKPKKKSKTPRAILGTPLPSLTGGGFHKVKSEKRQKQKLRRMIEDDCR
jgi:hypothetical protein